MNYANNSEVRDIIKRALKEDIGKRDISTESFIPKDAKVKAFIVAEDNGVICGIDIAKKTFRLLDRSLKFSTLIRDGDIIKKGQILAKIYGKASAILTAERVALNFLSLLSGIATKTKKYADKVRPYNVKILDTRKTFPGLRKLEKYAVRAGGGFNHRCSLDEMVLIKDNHLKAQSAKRLPRRQAGKTQSLKDLIKNLKNKVPEGIKIEVEVKDIREFKEALRAEPDIIMLDNMTVQEVRRAVQLKKSLFSTNKRSLPKLEVSGNINIINVAPYAATGIDFISLGTLTKDVSSLDLSLEVK